MNFPLVSIIIPIFNQRHDFLQTCIESALSQTYPNLEVILSDNHSTNNIQTILNIYLYNPKVRIIKPDNHLKIVPHFIFGASEARGEYLSFLSSDDYLYPNAIENIISVMISEPNIVLGYGEIEAVNHKDLNKILFACRQNKKPDGIETAQQSFQTFYKGDVLSCWIIGGVIKKEFYNKVFEDASGVNYGFDTSLGIKLHEFGKIAYINKSVSKWRIWRDEDGKVDAKRYVADIEDVCYVYDIIENSPILLSYLRHKKFSVTLMRYWRSCKFTAILIVKYSQGLINDKDLSNALKLLKNLSNDNFLFYFIFLSLRQPFISILAILFRSIFKLKKSI